MKLQRHLFRKPVTLHGFTITGFETYNGRPTYLFDHAGRILCDILQRNALRYLGA